MAETKTGHKRGIALVLVGMVLGAALITPAGAHISSVSHTWKKHFLPLAKKAFYTKTQSNAKYLGKTAKAADADKLDGLDSAAYAKSSTVPVFDSVTFEGYLGLTTTAQDVASVTISAPSDGHVIVTGSGTFEAVHTNGTTDFLRAFVTKISGAIDFSTLEYFEIDSAAPTGGYGAPFSITRAYPVSAGDTTFYLTADEGLGSGAINRANITALFVKTQA